MDGTFQQVVKTPYGCTGSGFTVQFQLKATVTWTSRTDHVVYDLDARAYSNMVTRERSAVPLILIVMCLPRDEPQWLRQDERLLVMKKSSYWLWLPGSGYLAPGASKIRVRLPRQNLFTTDSLIGILARAREYAIGTRNNV